MNAKQTYSVVLLVATALFGFAQSPDHIVVNPNNKVKVDFTTIDVKKNPEAKKGNQSQNTRSAECDFEDSRTGECFFYDCSDCDGICDPNNGICTEINPESEATLDSSGKTNGVFGVSPSGGATYTVPISLPPGIKEITPSLTISYNSQSGNGLAGWGWNIGGLSVISRIPSTTFHDGSIEGIDLDRNDHFALDGQRLILQSGTHGYSGSTYQTEHFSNIKIEADGNSSSGPTRFIVTYPDGTRAWYGGDYGNAKGVLEWALREVQDPQGNFVRYSYEEENNLLRIAEIEYGARNGTTAPNRIEFSYENRTRPEVSYIKGTEFKRAKILKRIKVYGNNQLYRKYTLIHDTTALGYQRVVGVQEFNNNNEHFPVVEFTYDTTQDGLTRDGNSLDLSFSYNRNTDNRVVGDFDGDQKIDFLIYDKSTKNQLEIFTDLFSGENPEDGYSLSTDSFDDVIVNTTLSHNGKVLAQQGITTVRETFSSGDQTSEVRFRTFAMTSNGLEIQYDKLWNAPSRDNDLNCNIDNTSEIPKQYVSGDFNGDGLTDVLAIQKSYSTTQCYSIPCDDDDDGLYNPEERGSSTGEEDSCYDCECDTYSNASSVNFIDLKRDLTSGFASFAGSLANSLGNSDQLYAVDFNGDGKTDLMHIREGSVRVYTLNAYNYLITIDSYNNDNLTTDMPVYIGDFNGDGKTDFVQPKEHDSPQWYFYFSKGNNIVSYSSDIGITFKFSTSQDDYHFVVQDFNGDGKSDILKQRIYIQRIGRGSTSVRRDDIDLYINKHNPNSNVPTFNHTISSSTTDNEVDFDGSPIFLEKNTANNILEYAYISGTNVHTYEFQLDHKKDVTLNKITNNGEETEITYESLGVPEGYDSSYSYDYDELYPYININIARSLKVVTEAKRNSLGAPEQQQLYRYKGAVSHAQGLGFMGFKTLRRSNWFGDNVGVLWTISKHDPQKRGAATQQWVSTSSYETAPNEFASKTTTTYATQTLDNKVFINLPTTIVYEDGLQGISSTETYTYDSYNNPLTTTTSFAGGSKTLTYEYFNNPSGEDQNYHIGRPVKVTETNTLGDSSLTTETEFSYTNNLLSEKKVRGTNTPWLTESFGYDEWGNITQKTISGEGVEDRTEQFTYDSSGRFLTTHTDILGLETNYTYHVAKGTVSSITDPYGLVTSSSYDSWQRLHSKTDYLGNETIYTYAKENHLDLGNCFTVSVDYPQGQDHKTYYNEYGWKLRTKVKTLNDQWLYQQFEHDAAGRVTRESEPFIHEYSHSYDFPIPSQWNQTYYDHYGRPVLHDLYNGKDISTTYDGLSVTVNDGTKSVTTTNDALGNIATLQDPGGTVNYLYHANGTMKSANYGTHTVSVEIDNWGRKTSLTDPSAGTYTYDYNILGEVLEETTPKGTTTYTYDDYGRLDTKTMTGDETDMTVYYNYYNGLLNYIFSFNDREDVNSGFYYYYFGYDSYKRPSYTDEYNGELWISSYKSYDDYGRVNEEDVYTTDYGSWNSNAVHTKNVYDSNGIHTEIRDEETDDLLWRINEENARGQALNITLGNGITKARTYDDYGFLTNISDEDTGTGVQALKIDYDFNAQRGILNSRTNHGFANWTEQFTHDNLDRLTEIGGATTLSKTYDNRGRITQNTAVGDYQYASTNLYQLTDIDLNTQGDLYYQQRSVQDITYNAHKKPIEIHEEGKGRVSFEYDPMMRRSNAFYGGEQANKYERRFHKVYSNTVPVEITRDNQYNSSKIVTYIGGDAYTAPIAHISYFDEIGDEEEGYYYLHRDYLGSILAISDSEGNVVEERQFGAWGTTDQFSDEAGNTDFSNDSLLDRGFTGHEHFFEVSLIHMNGRLYDPQLGRFLSPDNYVQDPYNTQSFNRYGYVWNNPLVAADPSGEFFWIAVAIGALIGGGTAAAKGGNFGDILLGAVIGGVVAGLGVGISNLAAQAAGFASTGGASVGFFGNAALSVSGFGAGFSVGFAGGFVAGLAGGAANAWTNGASFADGLAAGIKSGFVGGLTGGLVAGIGAGLRSMKNGGSFWEAPRPKVTTQSTLTPRGVQQFEAPKPKGDLSGLKPKQQIANTWDKVTNKRILGLDPRIQQKATDFINRVDTELGVKLRITDGFRSHKEQNILYAQGRTTPGNIVTYAKGGESLHNFGQAFDVVQMNSGIPVWNKLSNEIVSVANDLGLKWGGHWTRFKDYPHFYIK